MPSILIVLRRVYVAQIPPEITVRLHLLLSIAFSTGPGGLGIPLCTSTYSGERSWRRLLLSVLYSFCPAVSLVLCPRHLRSDQLRQRLNWPSPGVQSSTELIALVGIL